MANQFTGGSVSPGSRTLNDFKNRISGGGARPNLFECEITFPDALSVGFGGGVEDITRFLIKSASLPASTINVLIFLLEEEILRLLVIEHSILGRLQ